MSLCFKNHMVVSGFYLLSWRNSDQEATTYQHHTEWKMGDSVENAAPIPLFSPPSLPRTPCLGIDLNLSELWVCLKLVNSWPPNMSSLSYSKFIVGSFISLLFQTLLLKKSAKMLNIEAKMAIRSVEDMKRWQPRGIDHADLFLISVNHAWLLNELSIKKTTAKNASSQS